MKLLFYDKEAKGTPGSLCCWFLSNNDLFLQVISEFIELLNQEFIKINCFPLLFAEASGHRGST